MCAHSNTLLRRTLIASAIVFPVVSRLWPFIHQRVRSTRSLNDWDDVILELDAIVTRNEHGSESALVNDISSLLKELHLDSTAVRQIRKRPLISTYSSDIIRKRALCELRVVSILRGNAIPCHDHPSMTGVLLGVSGDAIVDTFVLNSSSATKTNEVILHRTERSAVRAGSVSAIYSSGANIHHIDAKSDTIMLDFFHPPYDMERERKTRRFLSMRSLTTDSNQLVASPI